MTKNGTQSRENAGQIECIKVHSGAIVRLWPYRKLGYFRYFLTLAQISTPKFKIEQEWMAPFDSPCSCASESIAKI
jgi:hypothetical protein